MRWVTIQKWYSYFSIFITYRRGRYSLSKFLFFLGLIFFLLDIGILVGWKYLSFYQKDQRNTADKHVLNVYEYDKKKLESFLDHIAHVDQLNHIKKNIAEVIDSFPFEDAQIRYNHINSSDIIQKTKIPLKSIEVIISMLGDKGDMQSCLVKLLSDVSSLSLNYASFKNTSGTPGRVNVSFYMELFFRS